MFLVATVLDIAVLETNIETCVHLERETLNLSRVFFLLFKDKGAFTHPVSECIFRIALQFFITYLD